MFSSQSTSAYTMLQNGLLSKTLFKIIAITAALSMVAFSIVRSPLHKTSKRLSIKPVLPSLKEMNFNCQVPPRYRLQSNCALKGSTGELPESSLTESKFPQRRGFIVGGNSQFREDRYLIERFFYNRTGGSFIEMGALDGMMFSNSFYFENRLGWNGLLIEGSPKLFKKLQVNRPDSITMNAMVCSEEQKVHWVENRNAAIAGAYELMPDSFRSYWHPSVTEGNIDSYPVVECKRLGAILETYGITHVDLWSLDVEGAELSVLETVDFSKFSASVIIIEFREGSHGVEELMTKNGYIKDEQIAKNDVYLHPSFKKTLTNYPRA